MICLSLATRRYPVFQADSDDDALAEIMTLFDCLAHCVEADAAGDAGGGAPHARQEVELRSTSIEKLGRIDRAPADGRRRRRCEEGALAWAALLGSDSSAGRHADAREMLWALLDGCLKFDEEERLTAEQLLDLPCYSGGSLAECR